MSQGYFITGTDTGVGKTLVSCSLLHAFSACGKSVVGMKPVAVSCEKGEWSDVERIVIASTIIVPREWMNPYALNLPIAPHIISKQMNVEIDISVIKMAYLELRSVAEVVIIEGVGGFLVPLNDLHDGSDMAQVLDLPVIMVVGMRLGCLNHALLTAQSIRASGLLLVGWVANQIDSQMMSFEENINALKQRLNCPLLGVLPFEQHVNAKKFSTLLDVTQLRAR